MLKRKCFLNISKKWIKKKLKYVEGVQKWVRFFAEAQKHKIKLNSKIKLKTCFARKQNELSLQNKRQPALGGLTAWALNVSQWSSAWSSRTEPAPRSPGSGTERSGPPGDIWNVITRLLSWAASMLATWRHDKDRVYHKCFIRTW